MWDNCAQQRWKMRGVAIPAYCLRGALIWFHVTAPGPHRFGILATVARALASRRTLDIGTSSTCMRAASRNIPAAAAVIWFLQTHTNTAAAVRFERRGERRRRARFGTTTPFFIHCDMVIALRWWLRLTIFDFPFTYATWLGAISFFIGGAG